MEKKNDLEPDRISRKMFKMRSRNESGLQYTIFVKKEQRLYKTVQTDNLGLHSIQINSQAMYKTTHKTTRINNFNLLPPPHISTSTRLELPASAFSQTTPEEL